MAEGGADFKKKTPNYLKSLHERDQEKRLIVILERSSLETVKVKNLSLISLNSLLSLKHMCFVNMLFSYIKASIHIVLIFTSCIIILIAFTYQIEDQKALIHHASCGWGISRIRKYPNNRQNSNSPPGMVRTLPVIIYFPQTRGGSRKK